MIGNLEQTRVAQAEAADPQASVWVNANAGAGKTHVLTLRVLRLLLAGTPPERILCLTYTKAAAAEMSKRLFDTLAGWAIADDKKLDAELSNAIGRLPRSEERDTARTLFASAIDTPGGLKLQTIHAFAERLLQRFPLEAGVTPGFRILDDADGADLRARAINATLTEATGRPDAPLGSALKQIIAYAVDDNFDALLTKAVDQRRRLATASRLALGQQQDDFAAAETMLRRLFGLAPHDTRESLTSELSGVLDDRQLRDCAEALQIGTATDAKHAEILRNAAAEEDAHQRALWLKRWFLTKEEEPRGRTFGAACARARPDLAALATEAQNRFVDVERRLRSLALVTATIALYRVASDVLQRYASAKRSAGALDFDDLIERTRNLLIGGRDGAAEWVLYKLDGGLDHILVDEAQDTSPEQWAIVEALSREFFVGEAARDVKRTVFAVGDEKQSIYSFQGAAPEMFAEMGRRFSTMASAAGACWRRVPLTLSFRSVAPVLDAIDAVFADPAATPGLVADPDAAEMKHAALRIGQSGVVELWPLEARIEGEMVSPWRPLDDRSEQAPANRLAERIGDRIQHWLRSGEKLKSSGRPITPGDILILVRKRHPFATPMVAALKRRGIPVAGADRMRLADQIAAQDLMALGDFLTLPEDDLALACVLKGPLFGFDDDDLLAVAHGRKGALWKALLAHDLTHPKFRYAVDTLKRWRSKADFSPPFEFYSNVLDRDGGRTRFLHRLGPEAVDAIDEFLDRSLTYDDRHPPSLTGFLASLRTDQTDVKRDMDMARDEVRVMTVHGAKGLEAGIVFLADACWSAGGDSASERVLTAAIEGGPDDLPGAMIWPVKGASRLPVVVGAKAARRASEARERNRLLYVAMTRARDRLYIAGFEGRKSADPACWYNVVGKRLAPLLKEIDDGERKVLRLESPQMAALEKPKQEGGAAALPVEPPDFASRRAPIEPQLSVPLAPSRLEPYAPDSEGEPSVTRAQVDPAIPRDAPSPLATADQRRFLRGSITHALLQRLPNLPSSEREASATAFVARRGSALRPAVRASIVQETMAILTSPDFSELFGPASRAEVAISAQVPHPLKAGPALRMNGQIDRLAVVGDHVLIVDYKTNRPPPRDVADVADAYMFQMAAYVVALREIYPDKRVRAALLWTDGPRLMELPSETLDAAIERLWSLDFASLDAP